MNEQKIWDYLMNKISNPYGAAGLMGNLYAESGLNPQNLQNSFEKKLGYTDQTYTEAVDSGQYTDFEHDSAGYGLAQWTYWSRKANVHDFAKCAGKSIGDLDMQLDFLYKELSEGYKAVLETLKNAKSVREASDCVLTKYERPADQGESVQKKRAEYGDAYYKQFAGKKEETGMTEKQIRQAMVTRARKYLGCKEADGSHRKIIDAYNAHKPLARGYAVKYTDAWCATFGSAIAIMEGHTDIIPTECGCDKQIELFQNMERWQENDAYVPQAGDYVFYDWDDNGVGDNRGASDHVGIVESCDGKNIVVIEGNKNDAVGERTLAVNGKYIRGFGLPDYASKATKEEAPAPAGEKKSVSEIAKEVINGIWGNGEDRKARLKAAGYDYDAVQKEVNAQLSGKATVPKKSVTEIAKEVIAGKWGNGEDRKKKLTAAGYDYDAVQKKVNELLK